jgi:hypothetical protein
MDKQIEIKIDKRLRTQSAYTITTFCHGPKYTPILPHWKKSIETTCPNASIDILDKIDLNLNFNKYAWWDVLRLYKNLEILEKTKKPVVHIDLDVIVKKDIMPLVQLDYDIIFSRDIGYTKVSPPEFSQRFGFTICSGFHVIKSGGRLFMNKIMGLMGRLINQSYSDSFNVMKYILGHEHTIEPDDWGSYKNTIINIKGTRICVLDFGIIEREPLFDREQYAYHINVDNVGGYNEFTRYFTEPLESLPTPCRCRIKYMAEQSECPHMITRRLGISAEEQI